jgi:NTP pyrophosphatase (non-canonical NTP hydrolase)
MDHANLVKALAKPGAEIAANMTDNDAHLIHMVLGICGEAGELLDAIKKSVIYKKPLDLANAVEELGDIEFYLEGLRQGLGIQRETTLLVNREKLSKRYAAGTYSDAAAQLRADKTEDSPMPTDGD